MAVAPQADPGELLARVQELSERAERIEDAAARELAAELVSAVIALYGDGLERILETVRASRDAGATILDELAQDGAVASLLLIHDLYPVGLPERVGEALDTVRPYMESHGGDVELLEITPDGVARLALRGSCEGCAASRATLETAVEQALREHAPDLAGIEVQGVTPAAAEGPVSTVTGMALPMAGAELSVAAAALGQEPAALPVIQSAPPAPSEPSAQWAELDSSQRPPAGGLRSLTLHGSAVLLADVAGTLLAYADECASCGEQLRDGELDARGTLRCRACEAEFELPRAGRAAAGEPLQLRPLPLLHAGDVLRVAV